MSFSGFDDFKINKIKPEHQKLAYGCQSFKQPDVKTSTIKYISGVHHYTRIYYPISSFKSFVDLEIDFDPFEEGVYYFIEVEYSYQIGDCVRAFKVTVPDFENNKELSFNVDNDITYIDGITISGGTTSNYALVNSIKDWCRITQAENYIEECRKGEKSSPRYLPKPDDVIGQIDDIRYIQKLKESFELLLLEIDSDKVINYDALVKKSCDNITENIIKPIIIKMICAPTKIFNIIIDKHIQDIEKFQFEFMQYFNPCNRELKLLNCVPAFHTIVDKYIDQDALTSIDPVKELPSIVGAHYLVMWELIKIIRLDYSTNYLLLKQCDTYIQGEKIKSNGQDSSIYESQNQSTSKPKTSDIDHNDTSYFIGNYDESIETLFSGFRPKYEYINPEFITVEEKYNILSDFDMMRDYEFYKALTNGLHAPVRYRKY